MVEHNVHSPLGLAVLAYLAPSRKRAPTEAALLRAMTGLLAGGPDGHVGLKKAVNLALLSCVAAGEVAHAGSSLTLTELGRERFLGALGASLPAKHTWAAIKRALVARPLSPRPQGSPPTALAGSAGGIAAAALAAQENLAPEQMKSSRMVADALAWQALGGDPSEKPSWAAARRLLLARKAGAPDKTREAVLVQIMGARALGASNTSKAALEKAALTRWWHAEAPADPFAAMVIAAASGPSTERFGAKAYIASIYDSLRAAGLDEEMESFKQQLLDAHQRGTVSMVRADLTPNLQQDLLKRSSLTTPHATFHFVVIP